MAKQPEQKVEEGVRDTFPASDPTASTATSGARAVPQEALARTDSREAMQARGTVAVTVRFGDQEKAKLALETVVRDAPLDRRRAEIRPDADAVVVEVAARPDEADRVREMLQGCGGR